MKITLPFTVIAILGLASFSSRATAPSESKAAEIASLECIAMLFDGGSIQFRFELSSGSTLELILNDREQMECVLQGVPEQSTGDWWLWVVKDRVMHFLDPEISENQEIEHLLTAFLNRKGVVSDDAQKQLQELMAIVKDRKRAKVSYNLWTGFKGPKTQ